VHLRGVDVRRSGNGRAVIAAVRRLPALAGAAALALSGSVLAAGPAVAGTQHGFRVGQVRVGDDPSSVAFDPVNSTFWVGNLQNGSISVIREATGKVVASVSAGLPSAITFDPVEKVMDVVDARDDEVLAINASTYTVEDAISIGHVFGDGSPGSASFRVNGNPSPEGIAVDPVNGEVLVSDGQYFDDSVYVLSGSLGVFEQTLTVGPTEDGSMSGDIAVDASTNTVYVAIQPWYSPTAGEIAGVTVINGATNTVEGTIRTPIVSDVMSPAVDPALDRLFVGLGAGEKVWVLSTRTRKVIKKIADPAAIPANLVFDPAAAAVFTANNPVLDVSAGGEKVMASVITKPLGGFGGGIAVDPATGTVVVANEGWNDTPTRGTASVMTEPVCTLRQLSTRFGKLIGGAGSREIAVNLIDKSANACKLTGFPGIGLSSGTRALRVTVSRVKVGYGAVILTRGQAAQVCLRWESLAGPFVSPGRIAVSLSGVRGRLQLRWRAGRVGKHAISVTPLLPGGGCP
jgi:DNA-binding beta-propeller fold protein YncE